LFSNSRHFSRGNVTFNLRSLPFEDSADIQAGDLSDSICRVVNWPLNAFRNDLDVNYQRVAISGESLSEVNLNPIEDILAANNPLKTVEPSRKRIDDSHPMKRTLNTNPNGKRPSEGPPGRLLNLTRTDMKSNGLKEERSKLKWVHGPYSVFDVVVLFADLCDAAMNLVHALQVRKKYVHRALMNFPKTLDGFLTGYYPENLSRITETQGKSGASVAYHPPDELLEKNPFQCSVPPSAGYTLRSDKGIVQVCLNSGNGPLVPELRDAYTTFDEYLSDFATLQKILKSGPLKSLCKRQLNYLRLKFQLHVLLNDVQEMTEQKSVPHRDFYNVRKVCHVYIFVYKFANT
uniref:HDAC_interact domain-containing protein n=1 Tax=Soboliphyme baturini TaxID=241478 RepID=A0A183IY76_9BILA